MDGVLNPRQRRNVLHSYDFLLSQLIYNLFSEVLCWYILVMAWSDSRDRYRPDICQKKKKNTTIPHLYIFQLFDLHTGLRYSNFMFVFFQSSAWASPACSACCVLCSHCLPSHVGQASQLESIHSNSLLFYQCRWSEPLSYICIPFCQADIRSRPDNKSLLFLPLIYCNWCPCVSRERSVPPFRKTKRVDTGLQMFELFRAKMEVVCLQACTCITDMMD